MISASVLLQTADTLGLELLGVVPVTPVEDAGFSDWIDSGKYADMEWMKRGKEKRLHPNQVLPNVTSIVLVTLNYFQGNIPDDIAKDPSRGLIARYAWYPEYHDVLKEKLEQLAHVLKKEHAQDLNYKLYVDTGPVLERFWAQKAGLGFIGKNSNLIFWKYGSYVFLGEILCDIELPEIKQESIGGCGTCERCMRTCPTSAIVNPKVIDARRCISYLTIENKKEIPFAYRKAMGNRIFGCDLCQEVCPWNSKVKKLQHLSEPDWDLWAPKLTDAILLTNEEFTFRYKNSPVLRTKHTGFIRNVAVALGNWGGDRAYTALAQSRKIHKDPMALKHIDWAIRECVQTSVKKS